MRAGECTGAYDCTVARHVHGCFADYGECDAPEEHVVTSDQEGNEEREMDGTTAEGALAEERLRILRLIGRASTLWAADEIERLTEELADARALIKWLYTEGEPDLAPGRVVTINDRRWKITGVGGSDTHHAVALEPVGVGP